MQQLLEENNLCCERHLRDLAGHPYADAVSYLQARSLGLSLKLGARKWEHLHRVRGAKGTKIQLKRG